ncbi:MAG TPA: hypothetical protein VF899_09945 [Pyrinomonadaceae bacterium]
MIIRIILVGAVMLAGCALLAAQEPPTSSTERRVPLSETAVALDSNGAPVLEATLKTTVLNGAEDSPVTNTRLVIKNTSSISYAFVSGLVTFYDDAGVRCGEGLFKADALAIGEAFETDTPGIRIRCSSASWRIVVNNLLPRVVPSGPVSISTTPSRSALNLIISVDGEEHPIQLDKPIVVTLGDRQRTIVLREAP